MLRACKCFVKRISCSLKNATIAQAKQPQARESQHGKESIYQTPAAIPWQPAAARREEGSAELGLHNRRRSLGVFLRVQRDRQGRGQAGLCREGAAGTRGWICPRQGFPLLPQAAPDTSRKAALEWGRGALQALWRSPGRMRPPGDILFCPPLMTTQSRGQGHPAPEPVIHTQRGGCGARSTSATGAVQAQPSSATPAPAQTASSSFHIPVHCKDV